MCRLLPPTPAERRELPCWLVSLVPLRSSRHLVLEDGSSVSGLFFLSFYFSEGNDDLISTLMPVSSGTIGPLIMDHLHTTLTTSSMLRRHGYTDISLTLTDDQPVKGRTGMMGRNTWHPDYGSTDIPGEWLWRVILFYSKKVAQNSLRKGVFKTTLVAADLGFISCT